MEEEKEGKWSEIERGKRDKRKGDRRGVKEKGHRQGETGGMAEHR